VSSLVLDAGALIAVDRNDRSVWAILRVAADAGEIVHVPAGVIAETWRDARRQVLLVRALRHCHEVPLDGPLARAAGLLCGQAVTSDVIDASVALTVAGASLHGDVAVLTSDRADIHHLLSVLDVTAMVIDV
jgi:hypothetical protein